MSASETETAARQMGWIPKEKYHGQAEWMDAETFVKKGKEIMPILQANNKRLNERLSTTEAALQETKALLKAAGESIEELKNFRSQDNKARVKDQKAELLTALGEAKKSGDTETEVRLTDQLTEVNAALKEADKPPAPKPADSTVPAPLTQEAKAWMAENQWFGSDQRKTGYAMGLANEWKAQGKALGTQQFFDHVDEEMGKVFDSNRSRREGPGKVDATNNSSGGEGRGSKTFADLPADAKAACGRAALKLVGKGRAYKTEDEWRTAYTKRYFEE
jgi:hypothetical protein